MFGNRNRNRKRRAASNPPLNGSNASANATTAAASAFLNSRNSSSSLSSAAAATALRSRPTTPISVADVQTKRTIRRAESNASTASAGSVRGTGRPQLERKGSSGSMSERTFRDQSPARSSPVPSAADAPPVPTIPNHHQQKSHRRAASLEAPPMRVASPPPNVATGRGSSLGPAGTPQQHRKSGQRNSSLFSVQEYERSASRGSVNFSLPTSTRPVSPVAQRPLTSLSFQRGKSPVIVSPTNQNLIYDPNTRSFLPQAEILAIEQRVQDAANAPVKKKKRYASQQSTGTHLAERTVGGRPRGTAIDALEKASSSKPMPAEMPAEIPAPVPERISESESESTPTSVTEVPKKKKKPVQVMGFEDSQDSHMTSSSDNDSNIYVQPAAFSTRTGAALAKKPSVVREDREREEEEDDTPSRKGKEELVSDTNTTQNGKVSPTPLPRSVAGRSHGIGQTSTSSISSTFVQQNGKSVSQHALPVEVSLVPERGSSPAYGGNARGGRVHSISPARTTHFANSPDSLVVKHQPPPRSISPRKSALKHAGTSRGLSPSEGAGSADGQTAGDNTDELSVPKRKANRVSFDETNVAIGQSAGLVPTDSPVVQSPQNKRPWYSIGRDKKKDTTALDDTDDEVMKPRPALPSFGSIRGQKTTPLDTPERPLVKPSAVGDVDATVSSSPLYTPSTSEVMEYSLGPSNDHIVGSIISQDATTKNTANISKSREPLPPQVTSVEGNGYLSDTDSDYSLEHKDDATAPVANGNGKAVVEDGNIDIHEQLPGDVVEPETPPSKSNSGVPEISLITATPILEHMEESEWPDMPGGWRRSQSDSGSQDDILSNIVEHQATDPTPAAIGIAEPLPYATSQLSSPVVGDIALENSRHVSTLVIEETEDSDNNSIYSDAAEDLSDLDDDGFMSLDAVVESPIVPSSGAGATLKTPPDSPTSKASKQQAYKLSQLSRKSSEPDIDEGWERAQDYWKGLSAEKKRQLELDARQVEREPEIDITPTPSPRAKKIKTKAVPQKPSQTTSLGREPAVNSHRTYMVAPGSKIGGQGYVPLRSSMRAEPPNTAVDTKMRKSMRGQDVTRTSLRGHAESEQRGALQKKHRPVSLGPDKITPDPAAVDALVKKMSSGAASAASRRASAPLAPSLRRRGSGDTDSSFKRERRSNDVPTFRHSMRGSNEEPVNGGKRSPAASSRFSLRSLSPSGSTIRQPFSNGSIPPILSTQTHMRNSMRGSAGSTPTLRGDTSSRTKSPLRLPGFRRSSNQAATKRKPAAKRTSRFDDSSDEEGGPVAFQSRFRDSSDDDDEPLPRSNAIPSTMRPNAPVRGIPRRAGAEDGDSSDLPDSDDEKPRIPERRGLNGASKILNLNEISNEDFASKEGGALTSGSPRRSGSGRGTMSPTAANQTRPGHDRRGSFMSILRRKKPDPNTKVRKSDIESAARRDTPLERSRSDLATLKAQDRPMSPKLQKRNPMSRTNSGAWPLPSPLVKGDDDERPFTSDGAKGVTDAENSIGDTRPEMASRRYMAAGLSGVDLDGADLNGNEKSPKKKKFGALRRIFRLDD